MPTRHAQVKSALAVALLATVLSACVSTPSSGPEPRPTELRTTAPLRSTHVRVTPRPVLSKRDLVLAADAAQRVMLDLDATVTSATVIKRAGTTLGSNANTGHPCTSGHELRIKLIGTFPHSVAGGMPVPPGSPTPDDTVRAAIITADARSGVPCLIGAQTGDPQPLPGGILLAVS